MSKTVAAITTPTGEGGIGIVQLRGPSAFEIVNSIFKSSRINDICESENNKIYYGIIHDNGAQIDEVIVRTQKCQGVSGDEYTVEINCHGGIYLTTRIYDLVCSKGALGIDWRENPCCFAGFAFDAGERADLVQNEAVIELPKTLTGLCSKVMLDQCRGALSFAVSNLIDQINQLAQCHDEAESSGKHPCAVSDIRLISSNLKVLLDTYRFGYAITNPGNVAVIGKPNVGKSTLINALLGKDRVLVHHEPGTTRDAISELISIKGIPFNLIDTAGVRDTDHSLEKKGIEISGDVIMRADKLIVMFDCSTQLNADDWNLINFVASKCANNRNGSRKITATPALNKIDLSPNVTREDIDELFRPVAGLIEISDHVEMSAIAGSGLSELEAVIVHEFKDFIEYAPGMPVIFNARQFDLINQANVAAQKVECMINENEGAEKISGQLIKAKHLLCGCLNGAMNIDDL